VRWRVDISIALAIAAVAQLDVWATSVTGAHIVGPRPVVATFYAVTALVLAWRRSHPFAVAMVVIVANALQSAAIGTSEGQGVLLPAVLALYSVGANEDRPRSLLALALMPVLILLRELTNPENVDLGNVLDALAWELTVMAAWLLGAYLRTRRLYVAELRERAARAEREREDRARTAVAHERARIARELHDAIAHGVSVMVVQAEAAEEMLDGDAERARDPLRNVQRSGRDALVELRRLVGVLREDEPTYVPQPGLERLRELVDDARAAGLDVDLREEGTRPAVPLGVDLAAYRIVQEGLTNVRRHAEGSTATVLVRYAPAAIQLEVANGPGASANGTPGTGHGIIGMRERARLYGGTFDAGPRPDGGFRVSATLPLEGSG
jgi:signal transduction histidine kinase